MIENKELEDFLKNNNISDEDWQKSECDWDLLQAIKEDYEKNISKFEDTATILVKEIQKISAVHSVRWRIKNTEHLLEKIIRKCADIERQEKYKTISVENYQEVVTDLVGIRALHLFKEDCFEIDKKLKEIDYFSSIEKPVAYLREGDSFKEKFAEDSFEIAPHKAGYRSIHYLLPAPLANCQFKVELQVRTIFEEGWSEIDHKIRYPNFSDNPLILHFLLIFNQIASTADEIGSFVLWLNNEENNKKQENETLNEKIQALEYALHEQENAFNEREKIIRDLENKISSLQSENRNKENKKLIPQLQQDIAKLKTSNSSGVLDLVRLNLDEMKKTSSLNSALGLNKLVLNPLDELKENLTKNSNGAFLRLNSDEIYKTSAMADVTKSLLPKDLALGLNKLALNPLDELKENLTKKSGLRLKDLDEINKASSVNSAFSLNDLVLRPLDKLQEEITKTQKLTGASIIDGLNNLNSCPRCFSRMSSSNKCPICGFSRS